MEIRSFWTEAAGLTRSFKDLRNHTCNLISLKNSLDLSTAAGRLDANIIASVASYETEIDSVQYLSDASGGWGGVADARAVQ